MSTELHDAIRRRREEILGFLAELIAIPTPNPPGDNYVRIVDTLRVHFEQAGAVLEQTEIPSAALSPYGIDGAGYPRPALRGRYGPTEGRSVHLHGHFDVVPANRPEQYIPRRADGFMWGRGSADMKGGLAATWGALLVLREMGLTLARPVTLSLTPDEESGGETGAGWLLRQGWIRTDNVDFLIMPECTSGDVWNASKGALVMDIVVDGKAAHSTLPHLGHNAFEDALTVGQSLVALRRRIETRKSASPVEDSGAAFSTMAIGGEGGGGEKFNIIPGRYHFTIDRRPIPEEDMADVRAELLAVRDDLLGQGIHVRFEEWLQAMPSFTPSDHPGCVALAAALTEATGRPPCFLMCPGFLDIRHFNARGVPTVACGPGRLEVAHGPNEHVSEDDILAFTHALALTLLRY